MGMAASQARLLSITARMHDVEYQAQKIMNEKLALATKEDAVYKDYCDALDAKKIQVAYNNGTGTRFVDATFASVCEFDESGQRTSQYALTDAESGMMIVSDDVYENYQDYNDDKYSFAWAMLGFVENGNYSDFSWSDKWGNNVGPNAGLGDEGAEGHILMLMTDVEELVFQNHADDSSLAAAYETYQEALGEDDYKKQKEALENFRNVLYSNNSYKSEIYDLMRIDKSGTKEEDLANKKCSCEFPEEFDADISRKFDYYVNLFEGIHNAGGCISITDFSKGNPCDNEWFNYVINSGSAILNIYKKGCTKGWEETSVATSTNENYLRETQDESDLKKAEAKYEHELSIIKRKDAKFDQDLSKLETERNALKTEYDSIKKVKEDNVKRTFGIFS